MIIDTPWATTDRLDALAEAGVSAVIRYFNHRNSRSLPEKRLTAGEAHAIVAAGLSLGVVFQQRQSRLADFSAAKGHSAGRRARELAASIDQPAGSAIYVAVDADFPAAELAPIIDYFTAFRAALADGSDVPDFRIGAYGGGLVLRELDSRGLIECLWVSMSRGFAGTRELLASGSWHLAQQQQTRVAGLDVDTNESNPRFGGDFGQWSATAAAADTWQSIETIEVVERPRRLRVTARRGLLLRAGPGVEFEVLDGLPAGRVVLERCRDGRWVGVDLEGDGLLDGYCHGGFLANVD